MTAMTSPVVLSKEDYGTISNFLQQQAGLSLGADKGYLFESRLMPVARDLGFKNLNELTQGLKAGKREVCTAVLHAMVTHETFFFRDQRPFDIFKDLVIPDLIERNAATKHIRIWCAACSSGQEPYTLAMIVKELMVKYPGWKFDIVGTDISSAVLEKAKAATYTQFEVQRGLTIVQLVKYFTQVESEWQLKPEVRSMVHFQQHNLMEASSALGKFDVVFCRNVLIYFDVETKKQVLKRVAEASRPGGYLYLGGAETVLGVTDYFKLVEGQRGLYKLV